MRTGVFGGTFNPVHNGHVKLAEAYVTALSLERLLIIPNRFPPHKPSPDLVSGEHRLAMCRLAFADMPVCEISDIELRRGVKKSYTVETLEELHRIYPGDTLHLIMGGDMFLTLTEWRDWRRIFELAVVCAGAREQDMLGVLAEQSRALEALGARCELIALEPVPVSSTEIRGLIANKENIDALVPPPVAEYISENGLFMTF